MQSFLLRLQHYNFQLNYVPGSQLFVADMLSRFPFPDNISEIKSDEIKCFVYSVIKSCQIREIFFFKNYTENKGRRLVPDLFF